MISLENVNLVQFTWAAVPLEARDTEPRWLHTRTRTQAVSREWNFLIFKPVLGEHIILDFALMER